MFAHPFRTFVLSYHINSRKYTFNINGLVGGDAHIAPFGNYELAEGYRKISTFCRVDVGIDPYAEPGKSQGIRRGGRLCSPAENPVFTETFGEFATSLGRTGSSAPTNIPEATQNRDGSGSSACSRSVSMSLSPKTSMPFFLKSAAVTPSPGVSLPEKVPS